MHPAATPDRRAHTTNDTSQLHVRHEKIRQSVLSLAAGSAGPSDLRSQHLKDAISSAANEAGNSMCATLTDFANIILRGELPAFIKPVFASATLISLSKKSGGITPIAIGETIGRLIAKCGSTRMLKKFGTYFTPIQLGAGAKHSCEAAAHVAREFITDNKDDTVFVKIDFANAFNSVRRVVI